MKRVWLRKLLIGPAGHLPMVRTPAQPLVPRAEDPRLGNVSFLSFPGAAPETAARIERSHPPSGTAPGLGAGRASGTPRGGRDLAAPQSFFPPGAQEPFQRPPPHRPRLRGFPPYRETKRIERSPSLQSEPGVSLRLRLKRW